MIINTLLNAIFDAIEYIFSFLGYVTIGSIPVIGPIVSSTLLTIVQVYHALVSTLPYVSVGFEALLYVILPFELLLIIARFFFGNRLPVSHIN